MVKKSSGVAVIERYSNVGLFDNEGPVFVGLAGGVGQNTRTVSPYLDFADDGIGKLGGAKVEVEGVDVTGVTYDDYGDGYGMVDFQIDGYAFRNMKTVNITYEVWDSLGNVTTGTVSRRITVWDIYEALGGPNYCSKEYSDTSYAFYTSHSDTPRVFGTLKLTSDGAYYEFIEEGSLSWMYTDGKLCKGYYAKAENGDIYHISNVTNGNSYAYYQTDRVYKAEPERCNYDNQKGVRYDLVENRFPVNGRSGANWYILRTDES